MKEKIDNLPAYLFHRGTNYKVYEYLGVHKENGVYTFRVWAPRADSVYLVGDFNGWDDSMPMERISDGGIWEYTDRKGTVDSGSLYKFKIVSGDREFFKGDPYARLWQAPPGSASVVIDDSSYEWRDASWLSYRKKKMSGGGFYSLPMNVYELHLGSWKRRCDGSDCTYSELATEISTYVKQMGYTHVELMPVMEHPRDASWGYQVWGYYAPTSRFGAPDDFRAFVDTMHEAGIGVILDWGLAHFPKNEHGLYEFDGQPLYECGESGCMECEHRRTRRFDIGRNEVECFLISNAVYWIEQFHIDGLRVGAVSSMIYPDHGSSQDEWQPDGNGGDKCLEAIAFFKKLNAHIKNLFGDVLMIAEESTSLPNITSFENDGLGFDMKWNMGWMNDTLEYVHKDPIYRKYHHEKMTFSLTYAFGERYMLPISHDEVASGKRSLIDKMPGEYSQKFDGVRVLAAYMMTHPGKKLMFMGSEIGQFREWDFGRETEWFLLDYEAHSRLQLYFAELNHFYLQNTPLWQNDSGWDGFLWIDPDNRNHSILSYRRIDKNGDELVTVLNFTPVKREEYLVGVACGGIYKEVFNSDDKRYGGGGALNKGELHTTGKPWNAHPYSLKLTIPPMGATILKCVKKNALSSKARKV